MGQSKWLCTYMNRTYVLTSNNMSCAVNGLCSCVNSPSTLVEVTSPANSI